MPWDPSQYLRFADHRTRPAIDLLARIPVETPRVVYDLGAGAGNVTRLLRQRWPHARIVGVDASAEMLQRARAALPDVTWAQADVATWRAPEPADVIFSNAALHWLGDHSQLFPRLVGELARGGVLAVQMPRNFEAPQQTAIAEAVRDGPWRQWLEPLLRAAPVGRPASYFDLLTQLVADVDIWETEYLQVLEGADAVFKWVFFEAYRRRLAEAYPQRADGWTLFPFKGIFIVAVR